MVNLILTGRMPACSYQIGGPVGDGPFSNGAMLCSRPRAHDNNPRGQHIGRRPNA